MSRLSIEITPEQHQRLKAMAALSGQTIKEYILERTLPPCRSTRRCQRRKPYDSWKPS
jgi:uncharacterized protein (DUF1778 family)